MNPARKAQRLVDPRVCLAQKAKTSSQPAELREIARLAEITYENEEHCIQSAPGHGCRVSLGMARGSTLDTISLN
jgi:hypothetical protein